MEKYLQSSFPSSRKIITSILFLLIFLGFQARAQLPVVTVRFANPEYVCPTQTYSLDVEFQCDTPNKQLFGINVRFFYDDNILEFQSMGEFQQGYGPVFPNPPVNTTGSAYSGQYMFGFTGAAEFINGAVQLVSYSTIYLSTTGWTKLFNVSFHVDDPNAPYTSNFCPSVVWDLEENPENGGFLAGDDGVVISVVAPPPAQSEPTTEHVVQFNWQYDGIPGYPYGYPVNLTCLSTLGAPVTMIESTIAVPDDFVTFPVRVWGFTNINSVSLTLDYNTEVLVYYCAISHPAIACDFEVDIISQGRINMEWSDIDTNLMDGSVLVYLTFHYLSGTTALSWYDDGCSCQFISDTNNSPLCDEPAGSYYINGSIDSSIVLWTGVTSNNWNTITNWQSNILPDQYSNVIISSSPMPPNWPLFTGNFTLGSHCDNLILNGNAQFSITGNFIIDPGHTLDITGSGLLKIGGNWTNSGIYNPGTGTVDFTGTSDGTIADGVPPEEYVANYRLSTFATGMTSITGGSPGPAGDNSYSDVEIGFSFNYLGIDYSQARINTNGWLSLNLTGDNTSSNDNIILFDTSAPTTVLAPWWDDLNADSNATIAYLTEGSAPNRVFITEWENILSYSSGAATRLNFQVKLYETTNIIEFCYGSAVSNTHNEAEGASIGIKDATGGPGNFIEATYNSTHLILACLVSDDNWPDVNYRFSPPINMSMETFYKVIISKVPGKLYIQRDVKLTGVN